MAKLKIIFRKILAPVKMLVMWIYFIWQKPGRIRFLPEWLFSFWPGKAAYKDGLPWLAFEAREWMDSFLNRDMIVFEWGSGGSTLFLAKKVKTLISVEHNPIWHEKISRLIEGRGTSNCQCVLKETRPGNDYFSSWPEYKGLSFREYCQAIDSYPDDFFDLVLVDGRARGFCVKHAIRKIRPKGFLLLDDSERLRYTGGIELLKSWARKDFRGPQPYVRNFYQTTIWQKPALTIN